MIAHPFEIKPSASTQKIDVLMITWRGTPAQSIAEIYLPAVSSKAVIALADKLYGRHRLTATDANTIQFPASDLTLMPIPSGLGRYAGLLSIDVRPAMAEGHTCVVSVRQLNQVTTSVSRQPPGIDTVNEPTDDPAFAGSEKEAFSWRNVQGAFQYTITSEPPKTLLSKQERLVAWLKWRISVTPATNRWLPVLKRYLKYTEILVFTLGKDPNQIPPSEIGSVGGKDSGHAGPSAPCDGRESGEWHGEREYTGKVIAIDYDRFGDFRGFVILIESGHERAFLATEHEIEELVREAWVERIVISVICDEREHRHIERIVLRRS